MTVNGEIKVTLNGHDVTPLSSEADALEGWVELFDSPRQFYKDGRGVPLVVRVGGRRILLSRRLYGDVRITVRGIPILRIRADAWG